MFGAPVMEHDALYDYAAEWLEIILSENCLYSLIKSIKNERDLSHECPMDRVIIQHA